MTEDAVRAVTVWLKITSWRGISFGAIHYYGELQIDVEYPENGSFELRRTLTASQAARMNKMDRELRPGDKYAGRWRAGETTDGFDTREDVIKQARKVWKKMFPRHRRLVLGDSVYDKPEAVLDNKGSP